MKYINQLIETIKINSAKLKLFICIMKCANFQVIKWSCRNKGPRVAQISCWILVLLIICSRRTHSLTFDNTTNLFVQKCQMECNLHKDFTTCGKYKVVRWLNTIVREKEFNYGPFRIIRIPSIHKQSFLPYLPRSRAFKSSITETLNFVRDSVEDLLTKRAIVYTIDNSAVTRGFPSSLMLVDEDELTQMKDKEKVEDDWRIFKKKKKSIIFPILIILNLIKLKLLLLPIILGVHFIKKILVFGSILLTSILAHLKVCKLQGGGQYGGAHHSHPFNFWSTAVESSDYPTGYGQDDTNWHRNDYQLGYTNYQLFRNPYGCKKMCGVCYEGYYRGRRCKDVRSCKVATPTCDRLITMFTRASTVGNASRKRHIAHRYGYAIDTRRALVRSNSTVTFLRYMRTKKSH